MLWAAGTISDRALVWRDGAPRWIPVTAIVPTMPRPYPASNSHAVPHPTPATNKIAAGVIAIVLPGLGIHKFLLGFTSAGLFMLFVSVIGSLLCAGIPFIVMAVISIVEGIIYLCKSDQDFYREYVVAKKRWF